MMKKRLSAIAMSAAMAMSAALAIAANADEPNEALAETAVGTAYIEFDSIDGTVSLEGEQIYADGQYDMTWDVSGTNINESEKVKLTLKCQRPNPLGIRDEVNLSVDEIWIDGELFEGELTRSPLYAGVFDDIYTRDEIVMIEYYLTDALDLPVNDSVRVVFSMTGLIDPSSYRTEHPTQQPLPPPGNDDETEPETTTEEAAENTTTEETAENTTAEKTTAKPAATTKTASSAANSNDSPKTGDKGVGVLLAVIAASGAAAYLSKKTDN